jgi:hypothetical protein
MIHLKNLFLFCAASAIVSLEVGCTPDAVVIPPPLAGECQMQSIKIGTSTYLSVTYDAQNRPVSVFKNSDIKTTNEYLYNSAGLIREVIGKDSLNNVTGRDIFTYNTANKIIYAESQNAAGQRDYYDGRYEYDASMRQTRENRLYHDSVNYAIGYNYTGSGDLPSTVRIFSRRNGALRLDSYSTRIYDTNKNLISETYYSPDSLRTGVITYTYDTKKLGFFINYPGLGRVSKINTPVFGTNNALTSTTVLYNPAGNITSNTTNNWVYQYNTNNYPSKLLTTGLPNISGFDVTYYCH